LLTTFIDKGRRHDGDTPVSDTPLPRNASDSSSLSSVFCGKGIPVTPCLPVEERSEESEDDYVYKPWTNQQKEEAAYTRLANNRIASSGQTCKQNMKNDKKSKLKHIKPKNKQLVKQKAKKSKTAGRKSEEKSHRDGSQFKINAAQTAKAPRLAIPNSTSVSALF